MEQLNSNTIEDIFLSKPLSSKSNSWTITSILGHILNSVEEEYGERDKLYTILGIELTMTDEPQLWFPFDYKIIIQIGHSCRFNYTKAVYQVAHEAVHCLCPKLFGNSSYLEEGLATLFSFQYTNRNFDEIKVSNPKYQKAMDLSAELLSYKPTIIKELRMKEPHISNFTEEMLINSCPSIPRQLAQYLTTNFQNDL